MYCMVNKAKRGTRSIQALAVGLSLCMACLNALAYSVESADEKKIYYGSAKEFDKPAEVDYQEVIKATPEYKQIKEEKIERGTGKYRILLSQASDRAVRVIGEVGKGTEYDLIAAQGYLKELDPAIPTEDITETVLETLKKSIEK